MLRTAINPAGKDLWVYGHSFTMNPGANNTAGNEFYKLLRTQAGFATVTTYGVGSGRSVDVSQDVINQAARTPMAGSAWDGTRTGAIVLDCLFNDVFNSTSGAINTTSALSATQQTNLTETLKTILAVLESSGRVECETGTKGGTWLADAALGRYSGGTTTRTSTDAATLTMNITVPAAGYVWLLHYGVTTAQGGAFTVTEGAQTLATRTAASQATAIVYSKRATAANETTFPFVTKIPLSPGPHTIVITKTGNDGLFLFPDAILLPKDTPPRLAFLRDPLPQPNTDGNVSGNPTNIAQVTANMPLANACADAAIAAVNRGHITVVDPGLTAEDQTPDSLHPNDSGMQQMATAIRTSSWLAGTP